jgi:hypothetical protein
VLVGTHAPLLAPWTTSDRAQLAVPVDIHAHLLAR